MAKAEKETKKKAAEKGSISVVKNTKNVVKNTTKSRGRKAKTPKKIAELSPDEKYKKYGVRCVKDAFKIYAENHPAKMYDFIEMTFERAKEDPRYAEMVIKCVGGFDAQETKLSGSIETTQPKPNPLLDLSIDEIRNLKALKEMKK